MIKIAIAGPDGSGKSTLCKKLNEHYVNSKVIHAVKHSDHFLITTTWGYRLLKKSKSYGIIIERLTKYLIFYPLEYIENLRRFIFNENIHIYDRHPIDRVILKFEFKLKRNKKKYNTILYRFELLMMSIWGWIYLNLFPKVEYLIVLLPTPKLCFERANGHYKTEAKASVKIEAYQKAIERYKKNSHNVKSVIITPEITADKLFDQIVQHIDLRKV